MSFDIEVFAPVKVELTGDLLMQNMRTLGWEIRLLDEHEAVTTDMSRATALLAWDRTYEPATTFAARYQPGVTYAWQDVPDDEADVLIYCDMYLSIESIDDWDEEEIARQLGAENLAAFLPCLTDRQVRRYYFNGSAHPYRVLLMLDLAAMCAWTTGGICYDPQEGKARFVTDLDEYTNSPLEQFAATVGLPKPGG